MRTHKGGTVDNSGSCVTDPVRTGPEIAIETEPDLGAVLRWDRIQSNLILGNDGNQAKQS